jgi:GNAT superfamily N-acetyltransferase
MLARASRQRRWTWRAVLQQGRQVLRDEGVQSLWFKILGQTVYRRVVLMECRLDQPLGHETARLPVVIDRLRRSEIHEYATFRPDADPSETHRRLEAGHLCFVARHEGQIVHACWAATGRAWVDYLACEIPLAGDEVYQYDSFTAPAFRGHNLAAARVIEAARYFRHASYRRLIAVVVPGNASAFRPLEKAGYRPFGLIGSVRIGRWRRNFCRVNRNSLPPGGVSLTNYRTRLGQRRVNGAL